MPPSLCAGGALGDPGDLSEEVSRPLVVACGSTKAIQKVSEAKGQKVLFITEGDRSDLLLALVAARAVRKAANLSGELKRDEE